MSKRRIKVDQIRNPDKYFQKYMAYEKRKDNEVNRKYYDLLRSLSEFFVGGDGSTKNENRILLADNLNGEEFEKYIIESSIFGWIEMIENEALFAAINQLAKRDKIILTLQYQYCLSQAEIAKVMGLSQSTLCWRKSQILKDLKEFLKTFDKKQ